MVLELISGYYCTKFGLFLRRDAKEARKKIQKLVAKTKTTQRPSWITLGYSALVDFRRSEVVME